MLPENTIVYPEQEQETFLFYSLAEKENKINDDKDNKENIINENDEDEILPYQETDKFFLSSAYGEE